MFLLSDTQIVYIVMACFVLLVILLMFLFPLIRSQFYKKRYQKQYYKVINKLVIDKDFLLINNFIIKNLNLKIDHIVFGNKFIYLIKDTYFEGALEGSVKDNKLIYYPYKNRDITTVENPYIKQKEDFENVARITGLNSNYFHLITLVNKDVLINISNINSNKNYHFVSKGDLIETINNIENAAKVKDFNQKELVQAAKDLARINERRKR